MIIVTNFNADASPSRTGRVPGHYRLTAGTYTARIGRHIHGDGIAITTTATGAVEGEVTVVATTRYCDHLLTFGGVQSSALRPFGDLLIEDYLTLSVTLTEDMEEGANLHNFLISAMREELRRRGAVYRDGWVMVESLVLRKD
jgi:hypothetical protein